MFDEVLTTVIADIAETLFAAPIRRTRLPRSAFDARALTAQVAYRGAFEGTLSATVSEPLARALAVTMLRQQADADDDGAARDVVGEIANIAAGNLRGLLAGDCKMSLPEVRVGVSADVGPDMPCLGSVQFLLFEQPLSIELRGRHRASRGADLSHPG